MINAIVRMSLAGLLMSAAAGAWATSADDDIEAARIALKEARYAQVITLTQKVAQTNPNVAPNWYRMAIAAVKMGDHALASKSLQTAQSLDPSLSFASTPARVEALQSQITAGLDQKDPAAVLEIDAAAIDKKAVEGVQANASALAAIGTQLTNIEQQIKASGESKSVSAPQPPALASGMAVWIVGFVLLTLMAGGMMLRQLRSRLREIHAAKNRDIAIMPLDDLVTFNRDNSFILMERLRMHGHKDTALYQSLLRSLAALETESGRARVEVSKLSIGVALSDVHHEMTPRAMVLGKDDPHRLHQSAARKALQAVGA